MYYCPAIWDKPKFKILRTNDAVYAFDSCSPNEEPNLSYKQSLLSFMINRTEWKGWNFNEYGYNFNKDDNAKYREKITEINNELKIRDDERFKEETQGLNDIEEKVIEAKKELEAELTAKETPIDFLTMLYKWSKNPNDGTLKTRLLDIMKKI